MLKLGTWEIPVLFLVLLLKIEGNQHAFIPMVRLSPKERRAVPPSPLPRKADSFCIVDSQAYLAASYSGDWFIVSKVLFSLHSPNNNKWALPHTSLPPTSSFCDLNLTALLSSELMTLLSGTICRWYLCRVGGKCIKGENAKYVEMGRNLWRLLSSLAPSFWLSPRWQGSFPDGASCKNNLLPMQETWETGVRSLGWEESLEEEMAIHSSILAGESHGQRNLVHYCP